MWPIIFEIPIVFLDKQIPIHGYGLMIVIGFLLAANLASREARRRGLPDVVTDVGLAMLLSGLLGGRLLHYIENYSTEYAYVPIWEFFKIWKGGLTFYGGAVGGFLGGVLYCWHKRLPAADILDVMALGAPIGMAFGRLGCFLNGCCYGGLCASGSWLGVSFPPRSPAHAEQIGLGLLVSPDAWSLPVHPTQLYQAGHDFLLAGFLWFYLRTPGAPRGGGIPLLFALYAVGRFFLEDLRGDNPPFWLGLTISQNISILLFLAFSGAFFWLLLKAKKELIAGS